MSKLIHVRRSVAFGDVTASRLARKPHMGCTLAPCMAVVEEPDQYHRRSGGCGAGSSPSGASPLGFCSRHELRPGDSLSDIWWRTRVRSCSADSDRRDNRRS